MKFITEFPLNIKKINYTIDFHLKKWKEEETVLFMNSQTVKELNGWHFHDRRKQSYSGIRILEDSSLEFGEIKFFVRSF